MYSYKDNVIIPTGSNSNSKQIKYYVNVVCVKKKLLKCKLTKIGMVVELDFILFFYIPNTHSRSFGQISGPNRTMS